MSCPTLRFITTVRQIVLQYIFTILCIILFLALRAQLLPANFSEHDTFSSTDHEPRRGLDMKDFGGMGFPGAFGPA